MEFECVAESLGECHRPLSIGLGQEDHESFTAVTSDEDVIACHADQVARDCGVVAETATLGCHGLYSTGAPHGVARTHVEDKS